MVELLDEAQDIYLGILLDKYTALTNFVVPTDYLEHPDFHLVVRLLGVVLIDLINFVNEKVYACDSLFS